MRERERREAQRRVVKERLKRSDDVCSIIFENKILKLLELRLSIVGINHNGYNWGIIRKRYIGLGRAGLERQ